MLFALCVPVQFKKMRHGISIAIATFVFSLLVESFQLVFKIGSFDVDDIMLNTLGGILGYIMYIILKKIILKISHRN